MHISSSFNLSLYYRDYLLLSSGIMSAIRPSTECATNGRIIIENKTSTIAASPKTSTAHNMILQATFITLTSRAVDRLVTSAVHCIYISRRISQSAARVPD